MTWPTAPDRVAAPSTMLEDAPLTVALAAGKEWAPQNSNNRYRGWVSTRTALEDSLNVPTARLALQVGLSRIVQMAQAMGITTRLQPVPALALVLTMVSTVVSEKTARSSTSQKSDILRRTSSATG